jgi:hypothetical protein
MIYFFFELFQNEWKLKKEKKKKKDYLYPFKFW